MSWFKSYKTLYLYIGLEWRKIAIGLGAEYKYGWLDIWVDLPFLSILFTHVNQIDFTPNTG